MASSRARLLLAGAILLVAAPVAAAEPTAADRETARALMQQGRDLRAGGNLAEALKRFKAADAIMHVPTTSYEVARVQVALGQLVEARDTIAAMRQLAARPGEPAPFTEARKKAEDLDASLEGRVPAVTVVIKGAAEGEQASVAIDDVALPANVVGLPRSVDPGHHVVTARTPSAEGKAEIDLKEGEQRQVEVTLASTAPAATDAAAGSAPGEGEPPADAGPARSHAPGTVTWIGAGVAGAGLIAGVVTGVLSMSKKSSLDGECANKVCGPSAYGDLDAANTLATVSTAAFVTAGVGAAVAIVSLVVGHAETSAPAPAPAAEPPSSTALRVAPWIGVGAAGLRGSF